MSASLSTPEAIALGIVALAVVCSASVVLLAAVVYRWTTRASKRYPVYVPERVRPEREPEIDLAKERIEFESRRDSYLENRMLGRVA